ncbi:glycosyltransferase family 4 protein [Desulfonatronovibrio hydrogenovorans]|uniref:glycosyltransferase family 4 protein n=1 Tax=Desulfonatronovibrio hydrogenovorans TaxID=53245 RepID=UPI00048C1570|nr:glycosyltransferase family 4 protein [Desulfonatronovibrio hydrogenovorans]
MRILFITDNFPPEVNAPATRTYEHCRQWVEQGAQVTVITCAPNFPSGRIFPGYKNRVHHVEYMDGIKLIRVLSYITANEGFVRRSLDYLSFAFSSFLAGLFVRADVIVATSPQFFTTLSGYGLSLCKRRPWVFEVRDLWPESIRAVGAMQDGFFLSFLERLELFLYRRATKVVAVSAAFKLDLVKRGITPDKIRVVTNGSNLDLFSPRPKDKQLVSKLGLEDKFVLGYIGTHGMAHGLDFILDCADSVLNDQIHFLFVGDGAEKRNLLHKAKELNLKNATFLDPVPKETIAGYISITDACLVPLRKNDTFKTVIPSKIFESAAMHKPILLGVEGQAKRIVNQYQAGICFEPENRQSFLDALHELHRDKSMYDRLQKGCLQLARDYDRKKLALEMLEIIKQC